MVAPALGTGFHQKRLRRVERKRFPALRPLFAREELLSEMPPKGSRDILLAQSR